MAAVDEQERAGDVAGLDAGQDRSVQDGGVPC